MEGKELYNNEDEEFDPKSKKEEKDSDDFGLPEIEDTEDNPEDINDPYQEPSWDAKKDDFSNSGDEYQSQSDDIEPDYSYNEEDDNLGDSQDEEYKSSYYEEEYGRKKSPVGWIIFGILVVIVTAVLSVMWWLNREPEEPIVESEPVIEQPVYQEPVQEEPVQEEPEPDPEPVKEPGVFEINAPTGRYHVIVASSIDKDLVHDYGEKLAKKGMTCNILAPRGNKKFHRLSVADYVSLNEASIKSEQLKNTLSDDVWVIRY